ncbi:MAG: hypothetical protein ACJAZT_000536 [Gammaproteobacteria bacterium]|jgi:hypothetical protein
MVKKSIVVLANSYKPGGRCIAGKEVFEHADGKWDLTGNWYRPLSSGDANHGSVTPIHHVINSIDIKLLDIITIDFLHHAPDIGQPENWLFDESTSWVNEGRFDESVCPMLTDSPDDLWFDNSDGVKIHEVGVAFEEAGLIQSSLVFIKPEEFKIYLSNDYNSWQYKNEKKSKASFSYNGRNYSGISMTDPVVREVLAAQYPEPDGTHVVATLPKGDDYQICVSLSPIFENTGKHYKLVASVI